MANISNTTVRVDHGDRLAQGEMVENFCYNIMKMNIKPTRKTDRDGGMGSTGK
jgi:dUTPase